METEMLRDVPEEYDGFDRDAWDNFRSNLSARKSLKLMKLFFTEETANVLGVSYTALRLVDDGVDLPNDGCSEDKRKKFLDTIEGLFLEGGPAYCETGSRVMSCGDPVDSLIPGPEEEVDGTQTERLVKTFYHNYGGLGQGNAGLLKDELEVFFSGMQKDLEKEGKLFTQRELEGYFDAIQADPLIVGILAVEDPTDITDVDYSEFYESFRCLSRGIMNIKNSRGKELVEDAGMNRVYFSREELDEVGLEQGEFLDVVDRKGEDARLNELIKNRVHRANAYFKKGAGVIKRLPDEGAYVGLKRYMVAYGLLAKKWGKNLAKNGYSPFSNGDCLDIEPGKLYKLKMLLNARKIGKGRNEQRVFDRVLDWEFLSEEVLKNAKETTYTAPEGGKPAGV